MADLDSPKGLVLTPVVALVLAGVSILLFYAAVVQRPPPPFRTKHVVIVGVDGVRSTEAFKNPGASPPGEFPATHPLLPRIWKELVPAGALFRNAKNVETTYTTPGFDCLLSGAWQMGPNRSNRSLEAVFENRSRAPLLSEIYRRTTGQPALWVLGKRNTFACDVSLNPAFGSAYAPDTLIVDPSNTLRDPEFDSVVMSRAREKMASTHPSLVFVCLGATDLAGHSGNFDLYLSVIRRWDALVADLWEFIQADPVYRDSTTLILTTDHGRHLDSVKDFTGHAGECDGCRDIMLLVLGPDTPRNLRVDRRVYPVDVAPTVAKLLSLELPAPDGEPLVEAVGGRHRAFDHGSREVRTAAVGNLLFTASAERVEGETRIVVAGSRDGGRTFPSSATLSRFDAASYDPTAKNPTIVVNEHGIQVAWLDLSARDGLWRLRHRTADLDLFEKTGDLRFGPERVLATSVLESPREGPKEENDGGLILDRPAFASIGSTGSTGSSAFRRELIAVPINRLFMGVRSSTSGFAEEAPLEATDLPRLPGRRAYPEEPSLAGGPDGEAYLVWSDLTVLAPAEGDGERTPEGIRAWNVYFSRSVDGGESWSTPPQPITEGISACFQPKVVFDPATKTVHVFYAGIDPDGRRQIMSRVGTIESAVAEGRSGVRFSDPAVLTRSPVGAWEPDVAIDASGVMHLVYTDFAAGPGGDVCLATSRDGKTLLEPPLNLSRSEGVSRGASISIAAPPRGSGGATRFVAWREEDPATGDLRARSAVVPGGAEPE